MPSPYLLATHITIALALTVLVGVQSAEVARVRQGATSIAVLRAALWAIPVLSVLTFITGGAVIADGADGGPWVAAGVLSTVVIAVASGWTLWRVRTSAVAGPAGLSAVQWGVPAITLAAAFLMAARPGNLLAAAAPVLMAAVIMVAAYVMARRSQGQLSESRL